MLSLLNLNLKKIRTTQAKQQKNQSRGSIAKHAKSTCFCDFSGCRFWLDFASALGDTNGRLATAKRLDSILATDVPDSDLVGGPFWDNRRAGAFSAVCLSCFDDMRVWGALDFGVGFCTVAALVLLGVELDSLRPPLKFESVRAFSEVTKGETGAFDVLFPASAGEALIDV